MKKAKELAKIQKDEEIVSINIDTDKLPEIVSGRIEEIPELEEAQDVKETLVYIYKYYLKNKGFIDATLNSAGKELAEEFIYNVCYKTFLRLINQIQDSKKLHINDRKAVARFYALGYSHSIIYYLATYKAKSLEGLLNCFLFESDKSFEEAVNRLLLIRSKQK